MKRSKVKPLEESRVPTARIERLEGIEALQCPVCHTIYPKQNGISDVVRCILGGCKGKTRDIKIDIHYPEGAF